MLRRFFRTSAIATLVVALGAVPAALADDAVCQDFAKPQRIEKLGTAQAFSKTPVASPDDLLEKLNSHRAELEALLQSRGVGHLYGAIVKAVQTGQGLSERNLNPGEVFEFMIYRKKDGPVAAGPLCYAAKKTYDAYVIEVTEETMQASNARCEIQAHCTFADEEMSADAAGSSPGVEVSVSGPGGTKTVISGGATSWKGLPPAPGDYTFTATAEAEGKKMVTTHTFIVPKICFNLAYLGKKTHEAMGEANTCRKEARVTCQDPKPHCELSAPAQVTAKEGFSVDASGKYDSVEARVDGADVRDDAGKRISSFQPPATISIRKAGTYTITGTATNRAGTATCTSSIEVLKPPLSPWTLRGFGLNLGTTDDEVFRSSANEHSGLTLGSGEGLGLSLEHHFTDRIGLEAALLWADLDALLIADLPDAWEHDDGSADFTAITLGPNFHLTPGKRVDFYIGPFVGWASLDDPTFNIFGETRRSKFGDDFVFGGQVGLDVGLGGGDWGLHFGVRYIDLTTGDGDDKLDVNPLIGEAGIRYRF